MATVSTPDLLLALRARYGLSQAQLAEYLSVSRAQISMTEQGRRALPTAAWNKLLPLLPVLNAPAVRAASALDEASRTALQARLRSCTHEAARLRQELQHLRTKAGSYQAVLQELVPLLRPLAVSSESGQKKQEAWLALREEEARQEVARSGPAAQALLELRIDALEYEAGQAALRLARALDQG